MWSHMNTASRCWPGFLIGQILGVAVGQLIGGISADYLGRRAPFVIAALLYALSTAALLAVKRRLPAQALAVSVQSMPATGLPMRRSAGRGGWRHAVDEYGAILRSSWARVVLVTSGVEGALVFGAFAFFAAHLHLELGVPLTVAGALVMPFGLGGFVFALQTRRLLGRLGETGLARTGGALMLCGALLVAAAPGKVAAAVACFAMGLGFYMLHNTLQTNATQMAPERRGTAVSAFAFSYFLGQSIGVAVAGWAVSRIGAAGVISTAAVGIMITAWVFAARRAGLSGRSLSA